jgi:uncharacterized protein
LAPRAGLIRSIENRFIYFPPPHPNGFASPRDAGLAGEEVWLAAKDGARLNAWHLPRPESRQTILWFHGNAEDICHGLSELKFYSQLGTSLLAVDYRGYGKSEGSPSEQGLYRDADAAYEYLLRDRRVQPREIVVLGHSLGGVVAIDLAARCDCGGLIVESSLTTAREMVRRILGLPLPGYTPRTRFDSLAKIASVRAPVLIVHGTDDETIPFSMGQRLYENAPQPKDFYPVCGARHNDLLAVAGQDYLDRLKAFLARAAS